MLSDFTIFQNKHFVAFMYSGRLVAGLFRPIRVAVKLQCCQSLQTKQSVLLKLSPTQPLATLTHINCRPGLYSKLKPYKQLCVSMPVKVLIFCGKNRRSLKQFSFWFGEESFMVLTLVMELLLCAS